MFDIVPMDDIGELPLVFDRTLGGVDETVLPSSPPPALLSRRLFSRLRPHTATVQSSLPVTNTPATDIIPTRIVVSANDDEVLSL